MWKGISMSNKIAVLLNHFNNKGEVVDSSEQELEICAVSDIVDHASQLIIVKRKYGESSKQFYQVLDELEEALEVTELANER